MNKRRKQDGWVLVTVALVLALLIGFAALAVDLGVLMSARASAQRAVDAAALAGALTFVTECPNDQLPAMAELHARQTAVNNSVMGVSITDPEMNVAVDVTNRRVTVNLIHTEPTYFARILRLNSANISVQAIAEASPNAVATKCAKPWFLPNTIAGRSADPCNVCLSNPDQVLVDGHGQVTPYAKDEILLSNVPVPGNKYYDISVASVLSRLYNKMFYALAFPGEQPIPSAQYVRNIAECSDASTNVCNTEYQAMTDNPVPELGQMTIQGITNLVTINSTVTPDAWVGVGQYRRPDGTISDTSHQLVTVPVWDVCAIATTDPDFCNPAKASYRNLYQRSQNLKVVGYARIFVELVGGNVRIHFVGVSGCGSGRAPITQETGPYGVPVRLVRTS